MSILLRRRAYHSVSPVVYTPVLPDDTYPMHKTVGDNLFFAVKTDADVFGYYCPAANLFDAESAMTGEVIQRVEYVQGDNDAYAATNYHMRGDDTLKIKFQIGSNASNIGGCFVSSSASDNFCLYAGAGAKWYMRYDGGNNRNYIPDTDWQELEATPTGAYVNGTKVETWTQASFTSSSPMYIGYLYQSTSPKIRGKLAYFEVVGKHKYLPVKVGSTYLMMDVLSWNIAEQHAEWSGGAVIAEDIPFPTEIYEDPVMLMMGGNPFSPEPEPEDGEADPESKDGKIE